MAADFGSSGASRIFKILTILGCVGTLAFLVAEMRRENFEGEWREAQARYVGRLAPELAAGYEIGLQQAFVPALERVDRCKSCHAGIDDPNMRTEAHPLRTHPGVLLELHPAEDFGCTICHQGQGRAVAKAEAHGDVPHWEEPLLRGELVYTSCSRCHAESGIYGFEAELYAAAAPGQVQHEIRTGELAAGIPGADILRRGKSLVATSGCLGCHVYRGMGGNQGPELTHVGDKGLHGYDYSHLPPGVEHTPLEWLRAHFMDPGAVSPGTVMPGIGSSPDDATALAAFMLSLRAADVPPRYRPRPAVPNSEPLQGRELYQLYCVACHGRDLAGSTVPEIRTPSLSNEDFLAVADRPYLTAIIERGRSGTKMPGWGPGHGGLSSRQVARIVDYILSFKPERAEATEVVREQGDARFGRSLYRGNCAACHGLEGEGGLGTRLNSPDFLAMASNAFLVETLLGGRPGTGMPSWTDLTALQVADLVAFLRTWGDVGTDVPAVLAYLDAGQADEHVGARLFRARCADCHGEHGQGGVGPSLDNDAFLARVGDDYLAHAIQGGRPGTAMPAWRDLSANDVGDLIAHLRGFSSAPRALPPARVAQGDAENGARLFAHNCSSCHGHEAVGGVGPQLRNPAFLAHASDGYLYETIAHGRPGTPMTGFLKGGTEDGVRRAGAAGIAEFTPAQIADVVAWLRLQEHAEPTRAPRLAVLGSPTRGRELYEGAGGCSSCHGADGQGGVGPALGNREFLASAPEGFLIGTMVLGRHGTEMRTFGSGGIAELRTEEFMDVAAYVRTLAERKPEGRAGWRRYPSTADQVVLGAELFAQNCASCHGVNGKGGYAPELNNPEFLQAASDGLLIATIARGRKGTPMRPFGPGPASLAVLEPAEIRAILGYLRSWEVPDSGAAEAGTRPSPVAAE
jgi:mono/diheme cytochrome c family protein